MFDRIIMTVDGSNEASHAARRGIELVAVLNATIEVLRVVS